MLVVTGPSGVGKGTLIRALMDRVPGLALSVSATTRAPRPGEVEGRDYHFLDEQEFRERIERGEFLEHARYAGNLYGTPRSELDRDCRALLLEIEVQGARQVRQSVPGAVTVFIEPPSPSVLRERLLGRGTDPAEVIERRLGVAEEELEAADEFHHRVTNDDLDKAVQALADVLATMTA